MEAKLREPRGVIGCETIGRDSLPAGRPLANPGCLIMLCRRGAAEVTVNSRKLRIGEGNMAFLVFDMVVIPSEVTPDFEAVALRADFDATQDIFFHITSVRFWESVYKRPVFPVGRRRRVLLAEWFDTLLWMTDNCSEAIRGRVLGNEAECLMLVLSEQTERRLGAAGYKPVKNRARTLANDFLALLSRHYTRHHDVAFYADRLNITPNYLNIVVRRNFGTTAKEQIDILLGQVMKSMLETTDLSVKQIADRLNFSDPSYLCRVFRRLTGMSPLAWRRHH